MKHKPYQVKRLAQWILDGGIDFDELNIILYKLGISTNKDSKSFGKITQVAEGYYPNLSACIRGMMSKQLMIDGSVVDSIKDLDIKIDAFCKDVWKSVNDIKQGVK